MNISKLVSLMGLAMGLAVSAGCSSSSSATPSGQGQSCTRTSDCAGGLVCIDQICLKPGAGAVDAGGDGGVVAEGGTPTPTRLGQACATQSDCGDGLTCVPSAAGGIQGGLCDLSSYGLTPTGKVCGGECAQDSDCCELPYNLLPNYGFEGPSDAGYPQLRTCSDLLNYVIGGDATACSTATSGTSLAEACNFFSEYCNGCVSSTWKCNNSQCQFTGTCNTTALSQAYPGACPPSTRTGRALGTTCVSADGGTTGTCTSTSNTACKVDADCYGKVDVDDYGTCLGGDCTCYQGGCYFQCASDLDCQGGYACDSATKLCKSSGCTSDAVCKSQSGNVKEVCNMTTRACALPCTNDHDCSPSSGAVHALGAFTGSVCGPDGFCASVTSSCTTNDDCKATVTNTVNTFCVPVPAATSTYRSAITN
jgi:hypothetical protein